jgi:hypothetical protein
MIDLQQHDQEDQDAMIKAKLRNYLNPLTYEQHKIAIRDKSIKDAHIYCLLEKVSRDVFGRLVEDHVKNRFELTPQHAFQIKTAVGCGPQRIKFNFTQIRLCRAIELYYMTGYYLTKNNTDKKGELYIFRIKKEKMIFLLNRFGGYTKDTMKKKHGKITVAQLQAESISDNNETSYALRPVLGEQCWDTLLEFSVFEKPRVA